MTTHHLLFLESVGGGELTVVMLFVLMFFGSSKIPELARGLGKGMREFKDAMSGVQAEIQKGVNQVEKHIEDGVKETVPPIEIKPAENAVQKVIDEVKQSAAAEAAAPQAKSEDSEA